MGTKYFCCYLFLTLIILLSGCTSSKQHDDLPTRYSLAELQILTENGTYPMEMEVDSMPAVISQKNPGYPDDARRAGKEGRVWLKVFIGKDGVPKEAKLLKTEGEKVIFVQTSIDAALEWRFKPALLDNEPVAYWITLPFNFKLGPKK